MSSNEDKLAGARDGDPAQGGGFADALQAALLVLPAFVLAWPGPGSPLRGDVIPQATGAGIAALLALPAAVLLLVRGSAPAVRALGCFLVPLLVAAAWTSFGRTTDTFEMSRALLTLLAALVFLLAGASSGPRGRRVLARGAMLVAAMLVLGAIFDSEHAFSGVLGNTGSISEGAVPGAAIALAFAVRGRGFARAIGAALFVYVLAYTARVPVLAGSLALLAVAVAFGVRGTGSGGDDSRPIGRAAAWTCSVLAFLALVAPIVVHRASAGRESTTEARGDARAEPGPTGGFEVRERVWKSSLEMLAAHPLAGVGPGQFAASFPAFRDEREIELSTHQRRAGVETEVEHPHEDWLLPALEGGVLAGLAWIAFLLIVLFRGWRMLRAPDVVDASLAAAAIGVSVNALVRAPLFSNPTSSGLTFAIFGALLSRAELGERRLGRRFVVFASVALLLVGTMSLHALDLARHGFALQELASAGTNADKTERAIADALAARPDSVVARSLSARLTEARKQPASVVAEEWERVLELRPLRVEALMQLGSSYARTGNQSEARRRFESALALDPGHPGLIRNLATLEIGAGHLEAGFALLDRLQGERAPSREWLMAFAERLELRGLDRESEAVLARADSRSTTAKTGAALAGKTAEECWALSKDARREKRDESADAWEARAHWRWARDHAEHARWSEAVRSYRQVLRVCAIHDEAPVRVRLELAAALLMSGRDDEARTQAQDLEPAPEDRDALPAWAAAKLLEAHLPDPSRSQSQPGSHEEPR